MVFVKFYVSCPNCGGDASHGVAMTTNHFPIEFLENESFQCESCNEEVSISIDVN